MAYMRLAFAFPDSQSVRAEIPVVEKNIVTDLFTNDRGSTPTKLAMNKGAPLLTGAEGETLARGTRTAVPSVLHCKTLIRHCKSVFISTLNLCQGSNN